MSTRSGKTYNCFHQDWASLGARQLTRSILDELVEEEENVNGDRNMATKEEITELLKKMDNRKISTFQPTTFSGKEHESAQDFMAQFESYAKLSDLKGEDQIVVFNLLLKGLAKFWFQGIPACDKTDFAKIKKNFIDTYLSPSKTWLTVQKLEGKKLQPGEKIENYVQEVIQMANNVGLTENEQRAALIRGLTPKLRAQLIIHNPQTLAQTLERIYLSDAALNLQNQETVNMVDSMTTCQLAGLNATVSELGEKIKTLMEQPKPESVVRGSESVHQPYYNPREYNTTPFVPRYPPAVRYPGHQQQQQQQQRHQQQQSYGRFGMRTPGAGNPNWQSGTCFTCGRQGHFARDCYFRDTARRMGPPVEPRQMQRNFGGYRRGGQTGQYQPQSSKNFYGPQR